jgi:CubicO group peptidase (beta-lactamase class C family)
MSKHSQTIMRLGVFCILILLAPFLARPTRAASPTTAVDVARIDAFVREQVERHGIPGLALALVDGGQIIHLGGYGRADQTGRPVIPQTPFVLASVSKPITALAIMQLVEGGKVNLDAPVQRYLPTFRVADPVASQQITLRHLLNHTSGIPEQGCQNSRFGAETPEQFVAALQTIELDTPPGTRHFYCSGNYNVLGRIIEVVSGQSYGSYIERHVFTPLQMRHSFASEQAARQDGLAQGYWWLFGVPTPMEYPYDVPQAPSGFLIASAEDLAHFLIAQLGGGRFGSTSILSPQGIAAMQAPGVPIAPGAGTYGLGWRTGSLGGVPAVFHTGDHPDAHTLLFIEPQTQRGAVLLLNSQNMFAQFGAFKEIEAGVARLLAGQAPAPLASLSLPRLYLIIDAVLGGLFALALWPLVRMRGWTQRLRQQQHTGQQHRLRLGLRLGWEFGVPVALLLGARLLLHMLGAQSWAEGLLLFPDFGAWLWAISVLMLLSGAIRLVLMLRLLRQRDHSQGMTSPSVPARQRRT